MIAPRSGHELSTEAEKASEAISRFWLSGRKGRSAPLVERMKALTSHVQLCFTSGVLATLAAMGNHTETVVIACTTFCSCTSA